MGLFRRGFLYPAVLALAISPGFGPAARTVSLDDQRPIDALSPAGQGGAVAEAIASARRDDWTAAAAFARQGGAIAEDIIRWRRLRAGVGSWGEYRSFLGSRGHWPGVEKMREKAEAIAPETGADRDLIEYFRKHPPLTARGARLLGEAMIRTGRQGEGEAAIISGWVERAMTPSEEGVYLSRHGLLISPYHERRVDMLLWRGRVNEAERLLQYLGPDDVAMAMARIALRRRTGDAEQLVAATNRPNHPGVAYERFRRQLAAKQWDGARAVIVRQARSGRGFGKPAVWAKRRLSLAHGAVTYGRWSEAYEIASSHGLAGGSDYAQLEWIAGWIALRGLKQPDRAAAHFDLFLNEVETPISLARGHYWMGRALEAQGRSNDAAGRYALAAEHQTAFYGQLAAEKVGAAPNAKLPLAEDVRDWRSSAIAASDLVAAAAALHAANEPNVAMQFVVALARSLTAKDDLAALCGLGLEMGRPHFAIRTAKIAARKGVVLPTCYYPVTQIDAIGPNPEAAFALSISRQESELNPQAISSAGARGLMQLMPGTARKMAQATGQSYSKRRLTSDWRYNAILGQSYLAEQLDRFGGSYVLTAIAYNAGPSRAARWSERYGDPRNRNIDIIDWIETIPFSETRNYVMRVMEGLHTYRSRLSGQTAPLDLSRDLRRGSF